MLTLLKLEEYLQSYSRTISMTLLHPGTPLLDINLLKPYLLIVSSHSLSLVLPILCHGSLGGKTEEDQKMNIQPKKLLCNNI